MASLNNPRTINVARQLTKQNASTSSRIGESESEKKIHRPMHWLTQRRANAVWENKMKWHEVAISSYSVLLVSLAVEKIYTRCSLIAFEDIVMVALMQV